MEEKEVSVWAEGDGRLAFMTERRGRARAKLDAHSSPSLPGRVAAVHLQHTHCLHQ